ncbi:MAG: SDR family NAD(P)-dependent oxidoreductase [Bryobacteraceae bacterium]
METIKDKVVFITGAGRGIGKRLALGFARDGARIALLARSKAELDLADLEIEQAGGVAFRLRGDVRNFEQVCAAVERTRGHYGAVHVLVCAAAIQGPIGPVWEASPKAWSETVDTNLSGVMHACRAVLPQMVERRSGKIIVLAGGGSSGPRPNFSAYASSKAAVVRFVESVAQEAIEHNVQINCMDPGPSYTNMTDEILRAGERSGWRDLEEAMRVRTTGGVSPDDQFALASFLASERSNHVTGKLIHVQDNWRKLERGKVHPEIYTLRRVQKV